MTRFQYSFNLLYWKRAHNDGQGNIPEINKVNKSVC